MPNKSKSPIKTTQDNRTLTEARAVLRGRSKKGRFGSLLPFLGPAFIASVAYVDPGNFATNIAGGAQYGYTLLWVIIASNLMAILIQSISAKLGIASGMNLAEQCRAHVVAGPVVPRIIAAGGTEGWRLAWYLFAAITVAIAMLTVVVQRDRLREEPAAAVKKKADFPGFRSIIRSRHAWHLGSVYLVYGLAAMLFMTFFQNA